MNIIDYTNKYSNKTFKEMPFNEVDALILSLIPYNDLTSIVPSFKNGRITLNKAVTKFKKSPNKTTKAFFINAYKLFILMGNSIRYQNILLYNYVRIIDKRMQFGAITMKLPTKSIFIAFSGTDSSIVGWEEDFKMAYKYPGDGQRYATIYLNKAIKILDRNVLVGGHSKGGNLAISSAMNANFFIKPRIKNIYNFDGPGFLKEQVNSREYKSIVNKIRMFVPDDSIVGMILYHVEHYTVVKSKQFNILQHNAFNWIVDNNHFKISKQNKRSKRLEKKITINLENYPIEKRLMIVHNIFELFHKNNIKDTREIKLKNIINLIKGFNELDKETKNWLIEFLFTVFIK